MVELIDSREEAYRAAAEAVKAEGVWQLNRPEIGRKDFPRPEYIAKVVLNAALPYLNPAAPEPPEGLEEARRRAADLIWREFGSMTLSSTDCFNIADRFLDAAGLPSLLLERDRLAALVTEKSIALKNEIERAEEAERARREG